MITIKEFMSLEEADVIEVQFNEKLSDRVVCVVALSTKYFTKDSVFSFHMNDKIPIIDPRDNRIKTVYKDLISRILITSNELCKNCIVEPVCDKMGNSNTCYLEKECLDD